MDGSQFDELTRILGAPTRRGLVGASGFAVLATLFGREAPDKALAKKRGKKKKKRKKKRKPAEPCGGETVCAGGRFCCDDEREICCNPGDSCCNVGPGTGSCCSPPNRCARPVGSDGVPFECCPPERQSFAFGVVRCCPVGERSLGTEISSDDGPCCPEEKYCSQDLTGGKCCPDLAPVCLDQATGSCCTEENACGDTCCTELFGDCCNGDCKPTGTGPWTPCGDTCCSSQFGQACCGTSCCPTHPCYECVGGACRYRCEGFDFCDNQGVCQNCDPVTGCGG